VHGLRGHAYIGSNDGKGISLIKKRGPQVSLPNVESSYQCGQHVGCSWVGGLVGEVLQRVQKLW
jgi:hypothetical protein